MPMKIPQSPAQQSGFTLIEIMLVVVIIGIMAGLASLTVGGNQNRRFDQDVQRLQQLLSMLQDEAAFRQQAFGVRLSASNYAFVRFHESDQRWHPHLEKPFSRYDFILPTQLELQLNGATLDLYRAAQNNAPATTNAKTDDDKSEMLLPDIVFLPDGEHSAFTLSLWLDENPQRIHRLDSDGFSRVSHRVDHDD